MALKRSRTEGIVLHRAEVYTATDYHFIVQRDGSVSRNVPLDEKGAHAKEFNGTTVGIAIFGDFASLETGKNQTPTDMQLDTTLALMKTVNAIYGNKLWATGHSALGARATDVPLKLVTGHTCPGEHFPLAEVVARSGCRPYASVVSVV